MSKTEEMGVVYKGQAIQWNPKSERWEWKDPRTNKIRSSESLPSMRRIIEQANRPDFGFTVLLIGNGYVSEEGEFEEATVLGLAQQPGRRRRTWGQLYELQLADGSIKHVSSSRLLADTTENRKALIRIRNWKNKRAEIDKLIDEQSEKLAYAEMPK